MFRVAEFSVDVDCRCVCPSVNRTGDSLVQMTHEQQRICSHNVRDGETIKIVAFAGECLSFTS